LHLLPSSTVTRWTYQQLAAAIIIETICNVTETGVTRQIFLIGNQHTLTRRRTMLISSLPSSKKE
jgi:hypothetical protein